MDVTLSPHEERRNTLIDGILAKIEEDVGYTIPQGVSKDARKCILQETVSHSRMVLEALSIGQLQNAHALDDYIYTAVTSARYLLHQIATNRSRS